MQSYSVGFRIFDALSLQTSDGSSCDCFVVVECCGQRYQTATKEDKQAIALFDEQWTWPQIELYEKEFESANIEFTIYERWWFSRNQVIGRASLQLSYINNRQNHLYARTWLQLRQDDDPEVKGQLNVSVFCIAAGQQAPSAADIQRVVVEEEEKPDGEDKKKNDPEDDIRAVILSTDVKPPPGKPHYVVINIHKVEDLAEVAYGLPSPFVTVEFNGCLVSTRTAPQGEQYSFGEAARIPVMTPIYEDAILIKLWSHNYFNPDELLAQGLVSFSELRNNPLSPQWFNLYGWDLTEVPDLLTITASGEDVKPNKFKGRILISGRVDKLEEDEQLQPAQKMMAKMVQDPPVRQVALFADVYMVVGLPGSYCEVELSFGNQITRTKERVGAVTQQTDLKSGKEEEDEVNDEVTWGNEEANAAFRFDDEPGRMPPIMCMTPEEPDSQPDVMVSVYTSGLVESSRRVAWCTCKLHEFSEYEPGCPAKPRFLALEPMPGSTTSSAGGSVLITIEYYTSDDVIRHKRKNVRPMLYIVRTYAFMARAIDSGTDDEPANYALKTMCSGMVRQTSDQKEVRPMWMETLDLKVVLFSDSHGEPPTCEPIHVAIVKRTMVGNVEIGKATCIYTRMRQKDTLDKWEPYNLAPQWIQVFGGRYGNKPVGEVLVAFELLMWKHREEQALTACEMWPQPDDNYLPDKHFSRLRRATLHFAMHGLRDLPKLPKLATVGSFGGSSHVTQPEIEVDLPPWRNPKDEAGYEEQDKLTFVYNDTVPGKDPRLKENQLRNWKSKKGLYSQTGWLGGDDSLANFEFLKEGKLKIEIPDKMILQPFVRIRAFEGATGLLYGRTDIGESLQSLANSLPCCWYQGVDPDKGYEEQKDHIKARVAEAQEESMVRQSYEQMSKEEYEKFLKKEREQQFEVERAKQTHLVKLEKEKPAKVDNFALPIEMKMTKYEKRPLLLTSMVHLNMQREQGFSPRHGREIQISGDASTRLSCRGKLENSEEFFKSFWFRNYPLLKNTDLISGLTDSVDWNFGNHHGFIKCAFKLIDDWEEEVEEEDEDEKKKEEDDEDDDDEMTDPERLRQTYDLDPELIKFAFSKDKFVEKYKSPELLPARVRVRVYLLKAICIFAKSTGFAEPYLDLQLGRSKYISMKNLRKGATNTPQFDHFEERDIELPMDGRLEISVVDFNDMSLTGDTLIGSTVIDLEDRWHSRKWNNLSSRQIVPVENRNFFQPGKPRQNFGALELFIEMLDSAEASDKKPSPPLAVAPTMVDIRIVIRTAEVLTLGEDEVMSVLVGCSLECDQYSDIYERVQLTDVHHGSSGPCKYDWRIVYPCIKVPIMTCTVEVKLYQYGALVGNTLLGSVSLDMKRYVEKVADTMDKMELPPKPLIMKNAGPDADPDEEVGSVTLEATVLSNAEAQERKAGIGRDPPNDYPKLFTPTEGRGWDAFFSGMGFSIPWPNWWKKLIPLIISAVFFLLSVVVMKQMGLM